MKPAKSNKCQTCGACKRLYRNHGINFWPHRSYYCTLREEKTERDNSCVQWHRRITELDLSAERFDQVQKDIGFLIRYLE